MNRQINNKQQRVIRKRSKFDLKGKHIGYTIGIGSMILVLAIMATFALAKITQYTLAPDEVLEANCDGRGFSIEPISRTEVSLKCVEEEQPATEVPPTDVPPTTVPPTDIPPTSVPPTDVPPTDVPPTSVPPTNVPPTAVPDHPVVDIICDDFPVNLVKNANFNSTNNWQFYTDGAGNFTVEGGGYCDKAARLDITTPGENVQLLQQDIVLDPNTDYLFAFIGKSASGHDLSINLHKHDPNYDDYGLQDHQIDLTTRWQAYFLEFNTSMLSSRVTDGRLRFWLAPFDAAGDVYWIDQAIIVRADLVNLPPLPPVIPLESQTGTEPTSQPPTSIPPTNTPVPPTSVPPTQAPGATAVNINFQKEEAPLPTGYLADTGLTFRNQGDFSYGWEADNSAQTRYYDWYTADARLASFTHLQRGGGKWEIALPQRLLSSLRRVRRPQICQSGESPAHRRHPNRRYRRR